MENNELRRGGVAFAVAAAICLVNPSVSTAQTESEFANGCSESDTVTSNDAIINRLCVGAACSDGEDFAVTNVTGTLGQTMVVKGVQQSIVFEDTSALSGSAT